MRISVDAMGGDHAPGAIVSGAVMAVKEYDIEVILVGKKAAIEEELKKYKYPSNRISIQEASEVIEMDESAATSVRRKRDSSIVKAIEMTKDDRADAMVSAGNTGAVVCAATLSLGLLSGIERPGIAIITPSLTGRALLVDVGANINPKPIHLQQYAVMATAYFRNVLNIPNPRVGLLNIGEEETKGPEYVKETYAVLEKAKINFIGNVEGKDIFSGKCDCIVCDGFVGNIALKIAEGLAEVIAEFLKRQIYSNIWSKLGALLMMRGFKRFRKQMDYSEYGGALLLGVNGIVIIGHGRSSAKAIKNAIRVAKEEIEKNVNAKIIEEIKAL
ncbi:MAG TPA: phosphate acyltransferase PlsX [Candidatus Omnitrophota bacterium]|nr:phosphate acyltransferase PlsX [Candidatus Omnitrophota bacterium]